VSELHPKDLALPALRERFVAEGWPRYRADQWAAWVYARGATRYEEMSDWPVALREELAERWPLEVLTVDAVQTSSDGTRKARLRTRDGHEIEAVLIPEDERTTLCVSTQVGCPLACSFCATGALGFTRNLSTAEIVDQVCRARELLGGERRLTNIVFMGMGEPLLNLDRVLEAVAALSDPDRFGLGARHVVISTSGVVPGIRRLAALLPQLTLAVSLHAARDPLRDVLVPLNRRWPVAEVAAAAREYARVTGRRVSYEYVMISGVNDTEADADALCRLLRGDLAHVNLIPMNAVAHTPWQASPPERVREFAARLTAGGVGATVRRNRGQDAGAACGQLAADRVGEPPPPAVERRRELILRQSEAALRGDRSHEALPSGLVSLAAGEGR
jgi:23S rRNA (adenine2503-C2)-methyltransferase